jgi:hypothetical protein
MTPAEQRAENGRIGAHISWAFTPDRQARTAPGRKAAMDRFEKQVDPDGVLDPAERFKRAENLKTAHFRQLARLSAESRARRKSA